MGRIKQMMVKRATRELIKEDHKLLFDDKFSQNKKVLGRTMPSKKVRNKIAGYVSRLKRAEQVAAVKAAARDAKKAIQIANESDGQYVP